MHFIIMKKNTFFPWAITRKKNVKKESIHIKIVLLFILQASIPSVIGDKDDDGRGDGEKDENGLLLPELEERLWVPHGKNKLADMDTDKFLIIARSVGTFARALDCSSSVKQPSLHMSAAAASRDVTLFHAHQLLHKVSKF